MVRKRVDPLKAAKAIGGTGTLKFKTIEYRWSVEEVTPGYTFYGYYGEDIPETSRRVSDYFDTEEKAMEWLSDHEPDEGKSLRLRRHRLVERTFREWVNY